MLLCQSLAGSSGVTVPKRVGLLEPLEPLPPLRYRPGTPAQLLLVQPGQQGCTARASIHIYSPSVHPGE